MYMIRMVKIKTEISESIRTHSSEVYYVRLLPCSKQVRAGLEPSPDLGVLSSERWRGSEGHVQ